MRARVRAAGPSGLPPVAPLADDAFCSKLIVAALLLLLLLELSRGATGFAGGAASSGGSVQGDCGASTTGWRCGFLAGTDAEKMVSSARCTGEVARLDVTSPAPSAAAGAPT